MHSTRHMSMTDLLNKIADLPHDWHGAGTVSHDVLHAIVRHSATVGSITHSCETGSGRTTLLLSHLSLSHTVFALDMNESITRVRTSPLLNADATTFVEMPTQRSLPRHAFNHMHQLVLIDGPHGYPFPDLEFYFLYPTLAAGGLLIVDDIRIPTIKSMVDIISAGPMFELLEVVSGNTAIFRRTLAPLLNPEGDDWWLLNYNKAYYEKLLDPSARSLPARFIHWAAMRVPPEIRATVPKRVREWLSNVGW